MKQPHFIVTGSFIQLIDRETGEARMIQSDQHPRQYSAVLKEILAKNLEKAFELAGSLSSEIVDVQQIRNEVASNLLSSKTKGRFTLETHSNGSRDLFYLDSKGEKVKVVGKFLERVLEAFTNDSSVEVLDKFLAKVEQNQYSDIAATDLFELS